MGKRKYKNKKKKKKPTNKEKRKISYRGFDGKKYDESGKEREDFMSDDEEGGQGGDDGNVSYTYVKSYLRKIKTSNKTVKAKEYLQNFKNKNWKFNKNNQIYLLKYILFEMVFPKEYFDIFIEYLVDMYPETKKKFIEKCGENIKLYNEDMANEKKMTFKIDDKELKYDDLEYKHQFLKGFHDRCVTIIEEDK